MFCYLLHAQGSKMFKITSKYLSIFNNILPASWATHITNDFVHVLLVRIIVPCSNVQCSSQKIRLYNSWKPFYIGQSIFCYLLHARGSKMFKITLKYLSIFNNILPASWATRITNDFVHVLLVRIIVQCSK